MLTKFESKSARVKGLAFHPHRPWVCATLHNGTMQLWDYRVGTIIDRFEEHDGPVRGVDFHITLPLIVSGGDDYKVKVWDYKLRRCLFTLLGHLDYIRTVQFHPQPMSFPWILSASDDQTLRLWSYETRTCLSVLTGHNHYVMCASFHPSEDLIVSASLDQTVRVWDATGLRKKHTGGGGSSPPSSIASGSNRPKMTISSFGASLLNGAATGASSSSSGGLGGGAQSAASAALSVQAELFGTNDVIVKYVLEGHDRGVNWAAFHPTLPLIVSAADDRQVKLWRMSDTKAWEVDTLRGHSNNVSCCLFHPNPKLELIISNSEDRSIRVWDVSKRVGVQTFRRESDRFWILAAHKTQNLLAAGHDTGMIIFKLERERPAYTTLCPKGKCYFVRGRELFCHEYSSSNVSISGRDIPITTLRRSGSIQTDGVGGSPRFLYYNMHNPSEGNILVCSDVDGGCYELVTFALSSMGGGSITDGKRGSCLGPAVFLGLNRFAVLDRASRQIVIKNMQNETTKKVAPPTSTVEAIYDGGTSGRLLLLAEDRLFLFEVQSRRVLADIAAPKLKSCIWAPDMSKVALLCKYGVILADRQLTQLCSMTDTVRIKSGAWDCSSSSSDTSNVLFVYTTTNHVKYVLPSGDSGTLRALENPVYATQVMNDTLFALDRDGRMRTFPIDTTEAKFKLAVEMQKYSLVMEMVQHTRLCGKAIVGYLQSKGFPEVALHFVREPRTRFQLALACGDIETGMEAAFALEQQIEASGGDPVAAREVWSELGQCALLQGNHQVVEMSYQRTKDLDRLSFLYLITGDNEKLRKMLKIANLRGEPMARYHTALLLGDVEERVKVLEESGNWSLAYLCAKTHGLTEEVERLRVAMETNGMNVDNIDQKLELMGGGKRKGCLLQPPTPIFRGTNWPALAVPKKHSLAEMKAAEKRNAAHRPAAVAEEKRMDAVIIPDEDEFGVDDDLGDLDMDGADAGWGEEEEDLMEDFGEDFAPTKEEKKGDVAMQNLDDSGFQFPPAGRPPAACWVSNSSHAADHLAAGSAASAMQLLNRQIAASNFSVLKKDMVGCYLGATCSLPGIPGGASIPLPLLRNDAAGHPGSDSLPRIFAKMKHLKDGVRMGYRYFEAGKFTDSKDSFLAVLHKIPLVVVDNRAEANEIKEILDVCREYITAVRLKAAMNDCTDPARMTELSAYLTHCNLQPAHLLLALRSAMGTAFKHKNYIAAAGFAQRLLELPDMTSERNAELRVKVSKVLKKSEQMARNENTLNYKENTSFVIDCQSLTPIYSGEECIKTSYTGSCYSPSSGMEHKIDVTDLFCKVGEKTLGLVTGS